MTQHPAIGWSSVSGSVEMNCSHNRDVGHTQMYWYRQPPGQTMTLVVYTIYRGQTDYGKEVNKAKYTAVKDTVETGALTVRNLKPEDSGTYFCAVSKHSDVRRKVCLTKTDAAIKYQLMM